MLFYGFKKSKIKKKPYSLFWNKKKFIFIKKYGYHIKQTNLSSFHSLNLTYRNLLIKIPSSWGVVIFQNSTSAQLSVYFYSNVYYFWCPLPPYKSFLHVDQNSSSIVITTHLVNSYYTLYWGFLINYFSIFHKPFFLKIKFKGKGYYIFKNKRRTITPQFGHSHRLYLYSYFVSVIFLAKTRIILFGFIKSDLLKVGLGLKMMRSINIFTGRGVRFNRQIIYRKTGKVSSYR